MRRSFPLIIVAFLVLCGAAVACTPAARVASPQHSCAPGFEPSNEYGRLTAQQSGPGAALQWGVHPRVPGIRYVVDVYVADQRVDHKDQISPPHGSVPADAILPGDTFRLEGQVVTSRGSAGSFFLTCKA